MNFIINGIHFGRCLRGFRANSVAESVVKIQQRLIIDGSEVN
jgi:hypothetical protein